MENLPVAEAWMKKNCCSACFTCPVCHHSLTTRITTVQSKKDKTEVGDKDEMKAEKSEKPEPPKKYYYLSCFFCHWTTRQVFLLRLILFEIVENNRIILLLEMLTFLIRQLHLVIGLN